MGAIRDFLDSVGRTKTGYAGTSIPGAPPADTASAADKAAFDESLRKYQLDRKAYEQYQTEVNNRLRNFGELRGGVSRLFHPHDSLLVLDKTGSAAGRLLPGGTVHDSPDRGT